MAGGRHEEHSQEAAKPAEVDPAGIGGCVGEAGGTKVWATEGLDNRWLASNHLFSSLKMKNVYSNLISLQQEDFF